MSKLEDIKNRISVLEMELGKERKALRQTIIDKIREIAVNEMPFKRISKHICIVHYSDVIGNPWTPSFYHWEQAAEDIINYLLKAEPKCAEKWVKILTEHYIKAKGNVVEIPKVVNNRYIVADIIRENKDGDGWVYAKYKINVSKVLIEKIIQGINEL